MAGSEYQRRYQDLAITNTLAIEGVAGSPQTILSSDNAGNLLVNGINGALDPVWPPKKAPIDKSTATIVTTFQTSHGFSTSGADASSNVNDTTTGLSAIGTQCATVVSDGAGNNAKLSKTGIGAIDTTAMQAVVVLRCDDITHLSSINLSFATDSGFVNEYHLNFKNHVSTGDWTVMSLALGDSQTQGAPTRSGITAVRVFFKDDNTGNKVTVHFNGIYFAPQPSAFANGVASICFDDGYLTQWDQARPLLDASAIRATVFPITDILGFSNRMTLAQVQTLQDVDGWEVGGHAYTDATHGVGYPVLSSAAANTDLAQQRSWLSANLLDTYGMAYPLGNFTKAVITLVRKYYRYARCTGLLTETSPCGDAWRLKAFSGIGSYSGGYAASLLTTSTTGKIDLAVTNKSWLILTFHNIVPTVSSCVMSGNVATITFATAHGWSSGSSITLSGFTPSGLNGNFTIASVPSTTTITVNIGSNPGNATIQGTALTATTDCAYSDFSTIVAKLVSSGIAIKTISEVLAT